MAKLSKRNLLVAVISLCIVAGAIYFAVLINGNHDSAQIPSNVAEINRKQQQLLDFNHQMIEKEVAEINVYTEQQPFKMTKSDIGFWYATLNAGKSKSIKKGSRVCMSYEVRLLDGSLCYSFEENGEKCLNVGQRQTIKGLDEALPLFKEGEEALILLPSYLAYGVSGDRKKIPPYTPVVYTIRILTVE